MHRLQLRWSSASSTARCRFSPKQVIAQMVSCPSAAGRSRRLTSVGVCRTLSIAALMLAGRPPGSGPVSPARSARWWTATGRACGSARAPAPTATAHVVRCVCQRSDRRPGPHPRAGIACDGVSGSADLAATGVSWRLLPRVSFRWKRDESSYVTWVASTPHRGPVDDGHCRGRPSARRPRVGWTPQVSDRSCARRDRDRRRPGFSAIDHPEPTATDEVLAGVDIRSPRNPRAAHRRPQANAIFRLRRPGADFQPRCPLLMDARRQTGRRAAPRVRPDTVNLRR